MGDVAWKDTMARSLDAFVRKVIMFLPNLLAMIAIFVIGFLIAWIVKGLLLRFFKGIQLDSKSEQWGLTHALSKGGSIYSPSLLLSQFFYWVIVLITLILGIDALQVAATQHLIAKFFDYLPDLFVAILIMVVGYLIASFLGQATLIAAVNARIDSAKLFGRAVRWFILLLALTVALYHLRIAEKIIIVAFTIIFGGVMLALAIAFGWGGRDLAKEFLEKLYHRKQGDEEEPEQDRISHI
jgi:hypothetical protein